MFIFFRNLFYLIGSFLFQEKDLAGKVSITKKFFYIDTKAGATLEILNFLLCSVPVKQMFDAP